MKITKILLSTLSVATLAFVLSACDKSAAVNNATATTANQSNTAIAVVNSTTTPENKTAPAASPKPDMGSVDFLNYTYQSTVCAEDLEISPKIKVSQGKFKDGDNFYNVKDDNVTNADVNGDGSEDAVVAIDCGNSAGTFRSFEIHAFTFENGKAETLAVLDNNQVTKDYNEHYPDSYVFSIPQDGVTVNNGNLVVDVMTDGSFAMPENISTFVYKLSGNKFILTAKPTKRKFNP